MERPTLHVGGYNWLDVWRRMYDMERHQGEAATHPEFQIGPDFWAGQAGRFASAAGQSVQPDGFMRFLAPRLQEADTLLDIGAGTGRYLPFLSQEVRQVLALEPSPAMRQHLVAQTGSAAKVIAASWPLDDPPQCDVAIAAHVLYGVRDIGPFLTQMYASARRAGYLLLALKHPTSYISDFWERLHGEPRLPLPGALECLNALYQLGIPAQLALVPIDSRISFTDQHAALSEIRWRLRLPPDEQRDAMLLTMIDELLEKGVDQRLRPSGLPDQAAVIWWERS
jgi:SAM-dependent methyltransferase